MSLESAETYFETRLYADTWLTANEDTKTRALATAEQQLRSLAEFEVPDEDIPESFNIAVYEQALFLLNDPDIERRLGLQTQGVSTAGHDVGESYLPMRGLPVSPYAREYLAAVAKTDTSSIPWEK